MSGPGSASGANGRSSCAGSGGESRPGLGGSSPGHPFHGPHLTTHPLSDATDAAPPGDTKPARRRRIRRCRPVHLRVAIIEVCAAHPSPRRSLANSRRSGIDLPRDDRLCGAEGAGRGEHRGEGHEPDRGEERGVQTGRERRSQPAGQARRADEDRECELTGDRARGHKHRDREREHHSDVGERAQHPRGDPEVPARRNLHHR